MKWVVVILICCGFFYLGKRMLPKPTQIDVTWKAPDIKSGMTPDQVRYEIGVEPTSISNSGIGHDESWFYDDEYTPNKHLVIHFIDGHVYDSHVETY